MTNLPTRPATLTKRQHELVALIDQAWDFYNQCPNVRRLRITRADLALMEQIEGNDYHMANAERFWRKAEELREMFG